MNTADIYIRDFEMKLWVADILYSNYVLFKAIMIYFFDEKRTKRKTKEKNVDLRKRSNLIRARISACYYCYYYIYINKRKWGNTQSREVVTISSRIHALEIKNLWNEWNSQDFLELSKIITISPESVVSRISKTKMI